jgi:hypothetical protein
MRYSASIGSTPATDLSRQLLKNFKLQNTIPVFVEVIIEDTVE